MDDLSWMNWGGWRWVSAVLSMAIGFYFGWSTRGVHEMHRRWREDFEASRARQAEAAAKMEGPSDGQ